MNNHCSPQQRVKNAQTIRQVRPWESSTGPRTEAGKARTRFNGVKHGKRSSECEGMLKALAALLGAMDATLLEAKDEQ